MRWPPWSSESTNDEKQSIWSSSANNPSSVLDWRAFLEPRTLVPTLLLTSGILISVRIHRNYLRRIPDAPSISPSFLRRRSVFGQVTSVGDGDNFRIFHTPGGRLAGWGWVPWKKVPTAKKDLKDNTVRRRLYLVYPSPPPTARQSTTEQIKLIHPFPPTDPHPPCRHRCPRTRPLRPPRTTLRARRPRLANKLPNQQARTRPRPPTRPVLARCSERIRATGVRFPAFPTEGRFL